MLEAERIDAVLVFTRTKNRAAELTEKLQGRGYAAEEMHGDLSQAQREHVIRRLRSGQAEIIVATDVAARGLDVDRVSHVVNFDMPHDVEAYVHRIGRTGRAGREGKAILLVAPRQQRMLRDIEAYTRQRIQPVKMPSKADVAARRTEMFKEQIRKTLAEENLELYLAMVEELADEGVDVTEVAAAAARLAQGDRPLDVTPEDEWAEEGPTRTEWCGCSSAPGGARAYGRRISWARSRTRLTCPGVRSARSTSTSVTRSSKCRPNTGTGSSSGCRARSSAIGPYRHASRPRTAAPAHARSRRSVASRPKATGPTTRAVRPKGALPEGKERPRGAGRAAGRTALSGVPPRALP